jgi:acetyltransferase-like isoleucine patch superfamily enzyme
VKRKVQQLIGRVVDSRPRASLVEGGFVTIGRDVLGWDNATFGGRNLVHRGTRIAGEVTVGLASTIGSYNIVVGPVSIGNYCQVGSHCGIYGSNHPMNRATTYVNPTLFEGLLSKASLQEPVTIGNDVWFGHGAIVTPGVSIGNGAVVGAGTVVTRTVPPYSVVVGSPGKVIRARLPGPVIEVLEASQWWSLAPEALESVRHAFQLDLTEPANWPALEAALQDLPRPSTGRFGD